MTKFLDSVYKQKAVHFQGESNKRFKTKTLFMAPK